MRNITIKDVAKRAGVSYTQVSRALNGEYGVSPRTAALVKRVAKEIGYQKNAIARSLVKNESSFVALLVNDLSNPYIAEIALSVISSANELGYQTLLANAFWDTGIQKTQIETMIQNRVAGILVMPSSAEIEPALPTNIPVVMISSYTSERLSNVSVDYIHGEFTATEHLIRNGYKKIAFIGAEKESKASRNKFNGFLMAMDAYRLAVNQHWVRHGKYNIESGYRLTREVFAMGPPDAIVCADDVIALGAMQWAQQNDISVPEQLGIIGFDDIPLAALPQINLTTMAQPFEKMGVYATKMLKRQIDNGIHFERKLYHSLLIERGTTRRLFE